MWPRAITGAILVFLFSKEIIVANEEFLVGGLFMRVSGYLLTSLEPTLKEVLGGPGKEWTERIRARQTELTKEYTELHERLVVYQHALLVLKALLEDTTKTSNVTVEQTFENLVEHDEALLSPIVEAHLSAHLAAERELQEAYFDWVMLEAEEDEDDSNKIQYFIDTVEFESELEEAEKA